MTSFSFQGDSILETKEKKPDKREYTIKIIPHQGEQVFSLHLPIRALKTALVGIVVCLLVFIGTLSYSVYTRAAVTSSGDKIEALESANALQQEQLSQLAEKANALQDEMEKLTEMEQELRRISGVEEPSESEGKDTEKHTGQGGPQVKTEIRHVRQTLDDVAKGLLKRRASLEKLRDHIREQQAKEEAERASMGVKAGVSASMPSGWPSQGDISSPYGLRWNGSDFHPGVDIANNVGTPIRATADGRVTAAGWNAGGYGNMVDIDHGNGIVTRYGHASQVLVSVGQTVKRGQIIAYMGNTGFSTGPHLHYEVRVNGNPVNPASYM